MAKDFHFFRCVVHNIEFQVERTDATKNVGIRCPLCLQKELNDCREKLNQSLEHRDALLKAIEIKQTVICEN